MTQMKKASLSFTALVMTALAAGPLALANDTTKIQTGDGQVEMKSDTSKNVLTGNTTTTNETEVKNGQGNTVSKRSVKIKKGKRGELLNKTVEDEKMDASGNTVDKSKTEETH